ncbi:hypothetical protein ACFPVX_22915 [Cohnella faecalis]|uniref:GNAT family N-acetyltransferase n=1 Tax=Cohnella faecalis TaxID=2315694 RepID=A0A398CRH1_9BACL|nr:hypothetical protein [Cohnella faecalis]RIE02427.1 hypothetical protein D3H35_17130 [Cohnella faecalis]
MIYKVAKTEKEFHGIYDLRAAFYKKLTSDLNNPHDVSASYMVERDERHIHLIAVEDEIVMGTLSICVPDANGLLECERLFGVDLSRFKTGNDMELRKLGIRNCNKMSTLTMILCSLGFEFAASCNAGSIFNVSTKLEYNNRFYGKLGFHQVADVKHVLNDRIMRLDVQEVLASQMIIPFRRMVLDKYRDTFEQIQEEYRRIASSPRASLSVV